MSNDLTQFVSVVGNRLAQRLQGVSLDLMDIGLQRGSADILTPGSDVYVLVGWVIRPATQEVKDFQIRIGGKIGSDTGVEDIDPMVTKILESVTLAYYPAPMMVH
jgi:hypothetical protein